MKYPKVQPVGDGKTWKLLENFIYKDVKIPAGFLFDFASIPRLVWGVLPPATGKYKTPALIHDWLCATNKDWWESLGIFNQAMADYGVPTWKRYIIYVAVYPVGYFRKKDPRQYDLLELQKREFK